MSAQTEAIIYLANQRGCTQSDEYRSYHTLNFGTYFNPYKKAIANFTFLNDETIKQSSSIGHFVKDDTRMLLIPLVGACTYTNNFGTEGVVDVGQMCCFETYPNTPVEISNSYKNELVNYLCLGFAITENVFAINSETIDFDLDAHVNSLISVFSDTQKDNSNIPLIYIGKFDGRENGKHKLQDTVKGIFVFVIEGAFEVQNRLLESRDGLFLRNATEIDFEALSGNAIILLIDGLIS